MHDYYTSLEDARLEIQKRWQNEELKKKVSAYLGGDIPEPFLSEPRAVLARNIASPDNEFMYFLELSKKVALEPISLEYVHDKFFTMNTDKMAYAKMQFMNDVRQIHTVQIVDFGMYDKKRFVDINTITGESLVDFHHRILNEFVGNQYKTQNIYDMSEWYHRRHGRSVDYYRYYVALFVCHGILFENFVTDDSEAGFEKKIVLPALQEIQKRFGFKPLIVPLAPDPTDAYWWSYSDVLEKYVNFKN